ncbi:MAG: helix-hairpin-helix domain-containing protein [Bacteroidota bacterium]
MKQILRDYFTFNRRERNGVFILLLIIILFILHPSFLDFFFQKEKIDFSEFKKEIIAFELQQKYLSDSLAQSNHNYFSESKEIENAERFNFNPNNLPDEDWKRLGFSDKQIRVIKNYESKGGKFRTKEDVKKMYCIQSELYVSLAPYIQIPKEKKSENTITYPTESVFPFHYNKHKNIIIELNTADTTALKQLKGIGSVFAKRIVKYRELLGGFIRKEQLMEVYGFDQEKFDLVSSQITLDSLAIKKININSASEEILQRHPYIDKKTAGKIYMYRINHGNYSDIQEIKKLKVTDEFYNKIALYLKVSE